MKKRFNAFVAWTITLMIIALVVYALFFSDLPHDLRDPFTPPH